MADFPNAVQAQPFALAGSGAIAGATSIILQSFKQIDGETNLTMSDFGTTGYGTIEPGNGTQEEQISFTGVSQNSNGTATLTGVKTVLFTTPYTETSGLAKTHPGSTTFVISNDAGFYNSIKSYVDNAVVSGGVPATTSVPGIYIKASTAEIDAGTASKTYNATSYPLAVTPDQLDASEYATYLPSSGQKDALAGNGGTPSSSNKYVTETGFTASVAAISSPVVRTYLNAASPATWTKPAGLKYVVVEVQAAGGAGGDVTSTQYACGGGGAGGYSKKQIAAGTLGSTETVTIGAAGNSSSFGSHCSANAGSAGSLNTTTGGSGGTATGGDINITGQAGGYGMGSTSPYLGGAGGNSMLGNGGNVIRDTNGLAGLGYGSGGGGASTSGTTDYSGGAAAPAIVIVTEFYV